MTATILDGAKVAADIRRETAESVAELAARGAVPGLSVIVAGDDPASQVYVRSKEKLAREAGIRAETRRFPATVTEAMLLAEIGRLNADPEVDAILVQLPLPAGIGTSRILEAVDPAKDVDGLHPTNLGWLVLGEEAPLPCTPVGILRLLHRHEVQVDGAIVVIVGRGLTVGRPLGLLLSRRSENATVVQCHTGTRDLAAEVKRADIVVAAAGVAHIITPDMVKPGAAVLDVGVSRVEGHKGVVGDVHPDVAEVAGWISPNPGGVGPMTRAMLLSNIVEIAEKNAGA